MPTPDEDDKARAMNLLTDEERAAVEEGDAEDAALLLEGAGDPGDDDDDGGGEEDAPADEPAEPEKAPEPAPAPVVEPARQQPEAPSFAKADEDRVNAINAEKDALVQRFDDGELSAAEYRTENDKLVAEEKALDGKRLRAEIAAEAIEAANTAAEEAASTAWWKSVNAFTAKHPEIKATQEVFEAFDKVVLGYTGSELAQGRTNEEKLEDALHIFRRLNPAALPAPKLATVPKAERPAPGPGGRAGGRDLPPTIGALPAAEMTDAGDGANAVLDRLGPIELEKALAKMTEDQRDQYLSRAG